MNFNIFKRKKKTPETRSNENYIIRLRNLSRPLQIVLDKSLTFQQMDSAIGRLDIVELAYGRNKNNCKYCHIYISKFKFYSVDSDKKFFKQTLHDFLAHFETVHKTLTTEAKQKC